MLRSSSTSRSSRPRRNIRRRTAAGLSPLLLVLACGEAEERSCLPPLFEQGMRLHDADGASLFDLGQIPCRASSPRMTQASIACLTKARRVSSLWSPPISSGPSIEVSWDRGGLAFVSRGRICGWACVTTHRSWSIAGCSLPATAT